MFFRPIWKTRWPPWPLIGWDIFDFSSETAEWNSTKLNRKQDLNVLYQVCVFRADRKNKMAIPDLWLAETFLSSPLKPLNGIQRNLTGSKIATSSTKFVFFRPIRKNIFATLASDLLRHFRLLLWNRWTEFNETWQEARLQRPLPSLCFSGRSEKTRLPPWLWLAETFSTSPLKMLNGIQRNLKGSKISTSSPKFVFFMLIRKQDGRAWPLIGFDIFDFSSETLNGIQWNLIGSKKSKSSTKFVFFRADQKNKMAALASDWLRHFRLLLWNRWTELNKT